MKSFTISGGQRSGKEHQLIKEGLAYVRQTAIDKGITDQQIADATGFLQPNVNRMLNGKYVPRLDNFVKLCEAVGIKVVLSAGTKSGDNV